MKKTLNPSQVTYVNGNWPSDNYSATDYLHAGVGSVTSKQNLTLIQFSLAQIPAGSVISSATMRLYSYNNDSYRAETTLLAKRNTSAFTASVVTYTTRPATTDANQGTCTDSGYDTWFEWNITEIARAWVTGTSNLGLTIIQSGTAIERVKCFKKSGEFMPQLVVDYMEPTPPGPPIGLKVSDNPFESSLTLSWQKGVDGTNNPIIGQMLECLISDNFSNWIPVITTNVGSNANAYTVPPTMHMGWSRGKYFAFRVGSISAYTATVYAPAYCYSKKNIEPSKPTNVILAKPVYVPGELIRISFNSSADPDGNLKGYKVQTSASGKIYSNTTGAAYVDVDTTGWTPGISYSFNVCAYDALGACSPWSDTVTALVGLPMKAALIGNMANKQVAQMKVFVTEGATAKTVKGMKVALAGGSDFKTVF